MSALLEVTGLTVRFGALAAVEDVTFSVPEGGTVGLVGESGSGKSVTALAVMGLLDGASVEGAVRFQGEALLELPPRRLQALRGRSLAMVFQDPGASLNPAQRVLTQLAEPLRLHLRIPKADAEARAVSLLEAVGVGDAARRAKAYPHELSGGLQQRAMIAMALACGPALLIADEPTTALDVTVQAQVMALLRQVQAERRMGLLLISHDLGLVAESCAELVVLYAGQVVERGPTAEVLRAPRHPYTRGLLASTPTLEGQGRLEEIPGAVPELSAMPKGCRFAERCPQAQAACRAAPVPLDGGVRCLFPLGGGR
ncbi:MAG: ABC transporter ATP-binding protein [Myxococcaceae bacterium]|nr:ABC transporter ATP-binding protein [Myxococcaceae bacterium]